MDDEVRDDIGEIPAQQDFLIASAKGIGPAKKCLDYYADRLSAGLATGAVGEACNLIRSEIGTKPGVVRYIIEVDTETGDGQIIAHHTPDEGPPLAAVLQVSGT